MDTRKSGHAMESQTPKNMVRNARADPNWLRGRIDIRSEYQRGKLRLPPMSHKQRDHLDVVIVAIAATAVAWWLSTLEHHSNCRQTSLPIQRNKKLAFTN